MSSYRFITSFRSPNDPRSTAALADAHALGLTAVTGLQCHDLYFIDGQVSPADQQRLALELLSDPVVQTCAWQALPAAALPPTDGGRVSAPPDFIDVALRPGVTDPAAEQIVRAARVLQIAGVERAATGLRFNVQGRALDQTLLHRLARRLLANATIQRYALGAIDPIFPHPAEASGQVDLLPLRDLDDEGLLALSRQRRAALDLAEMQAIQRYYRAEGRDPTDIELEMIAQTWSEHCVHKTFKARLTLSGGDGFFDQGAIDGLLKTFIRSATDEIAAPWVRSAFVDNAGIIDFDEAFEVSFKVETHNHPSAIEPFGGANTGVGGVIRDVLGVSAKPIANTDVLCFGPQDADPDTLPEGVLHPRRIQSGVVAGVQDYGNKIGIPTVNGAILYDAGYTANPLVFCGCVGIAPKDSHPRQAQAGDRVIVLGGGTGRDGLRGATFSSMTMDAQTGEVSGASVQIGDPITEKGLIEVVLRARDQRLYHAVTDCGAGGLSSAVGEMASEIGAQIELKDVRLKYPGLAPWEIWLSEAQERMVLAVPPASLAQLQAICATFDVALTDIGVFTGMGRLQVQYNGQVVLDLHNTFLHEGIPQRRLTAIIPAVSPPDPLAEQALSGGGDAHTVLLKLLSHPNIASKTAVIRLYDHEVQGGTVVKPLTGAQNDGPSDACVLKPLGTQGHGGKDHRGGKGGRPPDHRGGKGERGEVHRRPPDPLGGIVLSNGINPEYGKLDPYRMAWSVIDEAVRNVVAVGGDPQRVALLDNFCWGDPLRPETLGSLVLACRGCHDAAVNYKAPFISGKDSLNNEYLGSDGQRHAIPPTLLISAIGLIEDIDRAVTMDLKAAGNSLYLVGDFQPSFGGSHVARLAGQVAGEVPPTPRQAPQVYQALHTAMQAGLGRACHDLSEGGLAAAAAEMCIGGRLGLQLNLSPLAGPGFQPGGAGLLQQRLLFGETNGCLLVEVRPEDCPAFERHFQPGWLQKLGQTTGAGRLIISLQDEVLIDLPVSALVSAWNPAVSL